MRFKEFLDLIENNEFVEAHEVLEHSWKELKADGKREKALFLKGLINGATAIALYDKGKIDGAKRVWQAYEKYKIYKDLFKDDIIYTIMNDLERFKNDRF